MTALGRPTPLLLCLTMTLSTPARPDPPAFEVLPDDLAATAATLREEALASSDAWGFVAGLTTEVGPRPAGSANDAKAVAWAAARLRAYRLEVRTEEVTVPHWVRP